jgi:hypothetical protein
MDGMAVGQHISSHTCLHLFYLPRSHILWVLPNRFLSIYLYIALLLEFSYLPFDVDTLFPFTNHISKSDTKTVSQIGTSSISKSQ